MKTERVTSSDVKNTMSRISKFYSDNISRRLDVMDQQYNELQNELDKSKGVCEDQARIIKELRKRLDCSVSADDYEKKFLSVQNENATLKKQIEILNEAAIKQAYDALYKNDVIKAADKVEQALNHYKQMREWS